GTPAVANPNYQVGVWVRSNGGSAPEAFAAAPFAIQQPAVTAVTLAADRTAPQPVGTTIAWAANATGGAAPLQYKWWVFDGLTWNVVRDWAIGNTFAWTPAVANPNYQVGVWVRSSGGSAPEAFAAAPFPIEQAAATAPPTAAHPPAPQQEGTARAAAGGPAWGAAAVQGGTRGFGGLT